MSKTFPHLTIIGITGKIGSGKSCVAEILEKKGAARIDCDEIVHELYEPNGLGTQKIFTFFGEEYLNKKGGVDRKKLLRTLVKHPKKWEILNRMIHPLVIEQLKRRLRKIDSGLVVIEIQVYTSKNFEDILDEQWCIEAPSKIRHRRLAERKLKDETIGAISSQQNQLEGEGFRIIENQGSLESLKKSVLSNLSSLKKIA